MHGSLLTSASPPLTARIMMWICALLFAFVLCLVPPQARVFAAAPVFRGPVSHTSGTNSIPPPQAVASLHPAMPAERPLKALPAAPLQPVAAPAPVANQPEAPYKPAPTRATAPRFGLPETLMHLSKPAATSKPKMAPDQRGKKSRDGSDLIYALGPRNYERIATFADDQSLKPFCTPISASETSSGPLLPFLGAEKRTSSAKLAVSPLFVCDWKREYGERRPPVNERFAAVLSGNPDSFTVTHLDEERESAVVGISLDGLFRTNEGRPWSFKAAYGMDVRERVGDHTLYGGVEWRF